MTYCYPKKHFKVEEIIKSIEMINSSGSLKAHYGSMFETLLHRCGSGGLARWANFGTGKSAGATGDCQSQKVISRYTCFPKKNFTSPPFAFTSQLKLWRHIFSRKRRNNRSNNPRPTSPGEHRSRSNSHFELHCWSALGWGTVGKRSQLLGKKSGDDHTTMTDNTCHLWHLETAFMMLLESFGPEAMIKWTKRFAPSLPLQVTGVTGCHSEWWILWIQNSS